MNRQSRAAMLTAALLLALLSWGCNRNEPAPAIQEEELFFDLEEPLPIQEEEHLQDTLPIPEKLPVFLYKGDTVYVLRSFLEELF